MRVLSTLTMTATLALCISGLRGSPPQHPEGDHPASGHRPRPARQTPQAPGRIEAVTPAVPSTQAPDLKPERPTREPGAGVMDGHRPSRQMDYAEARPRALREGKVLVVWVGTSCPACERELTDLLHVHVRTFPGATAPCVVVGRPEGGELWRTDLPGQPTVEDIRRVSAAPAVAPAAGSAYHYQGQAQPTYVQPIAYSSYQPVQVGFGGYPGGWAGGFGGGASCGPRG